MIEPLLFLILVTLFGIAFILIKILKEIRDKGDFSMEDAQVTATTESIKEAKDRLPKGE